MISYRGSDVNWDEILPIDPETGKRYGYTISFFEMGGGGGGGLRYHSNMFRICIVQLRPDIGHLKIMI